MSLTVRPARASDAALLWQWRNDPLVRRHSFSMDPIPWEHHQRLSAARLASADTVIYIVEDGDVPIAQVRYERRDPRTAEIGGNVASRRAFEAAGFESTGDAVAHGAACRAYRYRAAGQPRA